MILVFGEFRTLKTRKKILNCSARMGFSKKNSIFSTLWLGDVHVMFLNIVLPSQTGFEESVVSGGNVSCKESSFYITIRGMSSKVKLAYPPF